MSLKDIMEDITFGKEPEEWELPFYGFKKGSDGLKQVKSLSPNQKTALDKYRTFFNTLLKRYGSAVRRDFSLTSPPEKEELTKLRKAWEFLFPAAKAVVLDRATQPIRESEEEAVTQKIISSALELVGIIPEKDEEDAARILKKYNGDFDLALLMIAKQITKTDNKSISERLVNCIRVIHAMKVEKEAGTGG